MPGDHELMKRTAEGDMDAFEQLVRRHQQTALNTAYRFLGDADCAEDVAQEAFLKILDAADRYEPAARFTTYLYTVVWRLCIDRYRRSDPVALEAVPPQQAPRDGPQRQLLDAERDELVRTAVDDLPPRQRMAVILKYFEDLSYEEIAEVMDSTPKAVESLLSRGRRRLRETLGGIE